MTGCYCRGYGICENGHHDCEGCPCGPADPTDAQLAGHGINTEVPDKELAR